MKNRYLCTNTLPYGVFMGKMKRTFFYVMILVLATACTAGDRYMTITGYAQGGTYAVKLNLNGADGMIKVRPEDIRDSVEVLLQQIDRSLSGYNRNSLLSSFNRGEPIVPDSLFLDIYSQAYDIYMETDGIVDVASAPLFDLWGFGFRNDSLPSDAEVEAARKGSGMLRLRDDMHALASDGTLSASELLSESAECPEMMPQLNFNAIAQGYSCDVVARYLYSIGVKDMMVDIGEIFCDGLNPSGRPWSLGIDRPEDGNDDPGAQIHGIFRAPAGPHGIVTSGNYRKFYVRDGKKYAHTIDPRTGKPVQHSLLSATIVAPDAMTADAYATYCMVVGLEEAKALLERRPDLEGCLIYDENGIFMTWCSEGFILEELGE